MLNKWVCKICKHSNESNVEICIMCDTERPIIPFELEEDEEVNGSNPRMWSEYIACVTWKEATKIAKSRRMKIPSLNDLQLAYENRITSTWMKNGYSYWSSEKIGSTKYLILNIENGFTEETEAEEKRHLRLIY